MIAMIGCVSDQPKEKILSDGKKGLITTCHGTRSNWSDCYSNASKACEEKFDILEKELVEHEGFINRTLYFRCK